MKTMRIMFVEGQQEEVKKKVEMVKTIVGDENVNDYGATWTTPEILVRCSRRQKKELFFKLDLEENYYIG